METSALSRVFETSVRAAALMASNRQSGSSKADCVPSCSTVPMAARNEGQSKCEQFCSPQAGWENTHLDDRCDHLRDRRLESEPSLSLTANVETPTAESRSTCLFVV